MRSAWIGEPVHGAERSAVRPAVVQREPRSRDQRSCRADGAVSERRHGRACQGRHRRHRSACHDLRCRRPRRLPGRFDQRRTAEFDAKAAGDPARRRRLDRRERRHAREGRQAARGQVRVQLGDGTRRHGRRRTTAKQWKAWASRSTWSRRTRPSPGPLISTRGDWDISWITLNVSSPDQIIGFMSGDAPTNFGHIDNAAYTEGVAEAAEMPGTDGCSTWLDAEANLVRTPTSSRSRTPC